MFGFGHIGEFAIGQVVTSLSAALVYEPVSRIVAGGFSSGRPAQVVRLGALLLWDNDDNIIWDNGDRINWS